jgi:hypothetical protein
VKKEREDEGFGWMVEERKERMRRRSKEMQEIKGRRRGRRKGRAREGRGREVRKENEG